MKRLEAAGRIIRTSNDEFVGKYAHLPTDMVALKRKRVAESILKSRECRGNAGFGRVCGHCIACGTRYRRIA